MQVTDTSAQEMLARVEHKADLRLALSHLNPMQIAILLLMVFCDISLKEAARICGLNSLQAQTIHEESLRTLKRLLGEEVTDGT